MSPSKAGIILELRTEAVKLLLKLFSVVYTGFVLYRASTPPLFRCNPITYSSLSLNQEGIS